MTNNQLTSKWSWTSLCGTEEFQIWSQDRHDFGLCFQQLCFHIPVLTLLAVCSSYYFGVQIGFVRRTKFQKIAILARSIISLILLFTPILQIYNSIHSKEENKENAAFLLCAVQAISWCSHFLYTLGLRKRLGNNPRGPTFMCIIWSLIFALTVVSTRSQYLEYLLHPNETTKLSFVISICYLILQFLYAITLIPGSEGSVSLSELDQYSETPERQPLITSNAYIRFVEEGDPSYLGVAMENVNWFSYLFFSWVYSLIRKGTEDKIVSPEDLYDLPVSINSDYNTNKLQAYLNLENDPEAVREVEISSASTSYSLLRALHKCYALQFYSIGILRLTADCCGFAGPMLLNKLVSFIENKTVDMKWGYMYAVGLIITTTFAALCDSHFNFLMSVVGLKMRGAIINSIYRKVLSVRSTILLSKLSVGEIMNYMSTDTDRIVNSCPSFHALWSIPFQLVVTLYLLYEQVGLAFLAGVIFTIILIPINKYIANKIGQLSTKIMEQKDERVKLISEILRSIRAIKLYVWEQHFVRNITKKRDAELKYLKSRKYLDALCVYFWATTPVIISILTFITYVLMGNKLTAATVFTSIALLNMLVSPLNAFPWVLNGMTEAWVSIKRIQKLLDLPFMDLDKIYDQSALDEGNTDNVIINGTFEWEQAVAPIKISKGKGKMTKNVTVPIISEHEQSSASETTDKVIFKLVDINLKIKKGDFIGVIGSVGCGKSTLISSILGELSKESVTIAVKNLEAGFGLVTQQPWLQRGTIRDNILFGKPYEEKKYMNVIFASGLVEDLMMLPSRDNTEVGDSGGTLSGGQKARIALARALYQEKPIYLLDDILSAVDVKVGKHIFQHCIMDMLQHKTRILCTHNMKYLLQADQIVVLENGRITTVGKPTEVLRNINDTLSVDLELEDSVSTDFGELTNFVNIENIFCEDDSQDDQDTGLFEEISERGSLNFNVIVSYWKGIGHLISCSILIALVAMQFSRNLTDWWLANGVTDTSQNSTTNFTLYHEVTSIRDENLYWTISTDNMATFLKVYIEFVCINTLFTLLRAFIFAYGGIRAAIKFHKILLRTVVKARSSFFDVTSIGRIINRFSSDTYTVDDSLPFILNIFLAQLFGLIGSICVTIYGLPWICVFLIPLIPVYTWLLNQYRITSRELKRISSVTLSPIYNHFSETLQGLTTIRAMRAVQKFKHDNDENLEANLKAQFASQAAARWLGIRLQFIGVVIISGVSLIAVIQHQYDIADSGFIGLAISYALGITSALSGFVNSFTETERELVAVERVNQYIEFIELETKYFVMDPPFAWPSQGVISFDNVFLQYRRHLNPSLNHISFTTRPYEKIGVVGRTGAGKSSLISVLFRLFDQYSGLITIDSVDIKNISLAALRSRMFCIPQEPFLFSGTLWENLDPLGEFKDFEIWNALDRVYLTGIIKSLGGLDYKIDGSGSNFSVGQKQLVCLARAVLHNAKLQNHEMTRTSRKLKWKQTSKMSLVEMKTKICILNFNDL
ncbi:ATP-binding cassette sub-family C member 10 isoform X2 [Diorhabda carinulata]|uniref:ATP-binding cassette sub-family C member 10 isoform X2 n=1 Tax=Diorhabda carinulata TaxID=1163345 RepID=UPI0025A0EB70|nr:ATP-binding cassette sub-family C member 10 isoform X2 [Diorhabda carinulata]